jgi:hypothetical protein
LHKKKAAIAIALVSVCVVLILVYWIYRRRIKMNQSHETDRKSRPKSVRIDEKVNQDDNMGDDLRKSLIGRSCGEIYVGSKNSFVFGLGGEFYLTVAHTWIGVPPDEVVTVKFSNGIRKVFSRQLEMVRVAGTDATVIKIPNLPCRNRLKNFIQNSDLPKLLKGKNRKDIQFVCGDGKTATIRDVPYAEYDASIILDATRTITTAGSFRMNIATSSGDCGAVYMMKDPTMASRRLLGIHSGYQNHGAICEVLTQEKLQATLDQFGDGLRTFDILESEGVKENQTYDHSAPCSSSFGCSVVVGSVPPSQRAFMARETEFELTTFGEESAPSTAPLHMKPFYNSEGEYKNPTQYYMETLNSYESVPVDERRIIDAIGELWREWKPNYFRESVVSLESALNGHPLSSINAITKATSAGHTLRKMVTKGKDPLVQFDEDRQCYHLIGYFEDQLKDYLERMRKTGSYPENLVKDAWKDERKPHADVERGKARLVSGSNLLYWIAFRMYFTSWLDSVKSTHPFGPCEVGINALGPEWDMLRKYLFGVDVEEEVRFIMGDYRGFDISMPFELREILLEEILKFYESLGASEEDQMMRRLLWRSSSCHFHIFMDMIYARFNGQDSGNPATAETNSIIGDIIVRTCFVSSCLKMGFTLTQAREMWKRAVRAVYYGDDNLIALSREARFFTQRVLKAEIKEIFGMGYTSVDKGDFKYDHTPHSEISFLKRDFYFHPDTKTYVGRMPLEQIIDIARWWRKGSGEAASEMISNMENSLRELFYYGEHTFDNFRQTFDDHLKKQGLPILTISYGDCLLAFANSY